MLQIPTSLVANPQYYDYLHFLRLKDDGEILMMGGGGQVINIHIEGHYQIHQQKNSIQLNLTELAQYNPYSKEKLHDIDNLILKFQPEEGTFAIRQEVIWKIKNPDDYPYLLYKVRYRCDIDPINHVNQRPIRNLYQLTENKDFEDSQKIYYASADRQELSLADLKKLGIKPPS